MVETTTADLHQQALEYLTTEDYTRAITLYQKIVDLEPASRSAYWYLGLALLLQGQEIEAQVTWMLVIGEGNEEEAETWTAELIEILAREGDRLEKANNHQLAWVIRQHIREINPSDITNLLKLIQLGLKLETLTEEEIEATQIFSLLAADPKTVNLDFSLLLQTLQLFLDKIPLDPTTPKIAEAFLPHVLCHNPLYFIDILLFSCLKITQNLQRPDVAVTLTKIVLKAAPENLEAWRHLSAYYQSTPEYDKGIEAAKKAYSLSKTPLDKIIGNYLQIRALMGAGGYWQEAVTVSNQQSELLLSLHPEDARNYELVTSIRLYTTGYFFPYFQDNAAQNRHIHNYLAQFSQVGIEFHAQEQIQRYRQSWHPPSDPNKRLRIGYLSHCMATHSVGWLARWLFQHHDREKYDIYAYVVNYRSLFKDPLQEWYVENVTQARKLGLDYFEAANQISEDQVDILVDMDSLTLDLAGAVMAMKPAPIQVSWLGWDAPGIPTVDYMIADPYVLPDNAQDYYREKIWRLPETYVAIDGFEVGVPALRREMLDIPSDGILYFSSQRGYKRHPETARLQLKIIKEVPNSYFLIKGFGDQEAIKRLFIQLAEEEGVSEERLKFVLPAPSEAMHRANMSIADVVLDTYPYNGATTTLETLWMGIPLVTRVGQQFAARNSYTMMMNVGVTEGIAWTDEEYIEWGVRLGREPELRQKVVWKLRESRKTSPLWNGKRFAREMEKAYEQMWRRYVDGG